MSIEVEILKTNVAQLEQQLRVLSEKYLAAATRNEIEFGTVQVDSKGKASVLVLAPAPPGVYTVTVVRKVDA